MSKTKLSIVTRTQANNRALKEGAVRMPDFEFEFNEVSPLPKAFRRMVRELAYEVSEMALTTYICARAHGVKFTALPIFLVRGFHHGAILHNVRAGISGPKDLAGRRVAVNRGYTVTTGVWARAILQEEHDLDLSGVTWALSGDEHVEAWRAPANTEPLGGSGSLEAQLGKGDIVAAVGAVTDHPDVAPMIAHSFQAGVDAMTSRGFYPINHLIVVRDDVLQAHPDVAEQLFDAFSQSKRLYVEDLKAGRITSLAPIDRVHLAALEVMNDPLPYGIAPNAAVLDGLMRHAVTQGIIPQAVPLEDLFAPALRDRVG